MPLLGTAYLESTLQTPKGVDDLTPSTCYNFSRFQQLLRQFRALDDAVIMRMSRAHALHRARDDSYAVFDQRECSALWSDLVGNWQQRERIISYCVDATSQPPQLAETTPKGAATIDDEPFTRRVLTQQIKNELAVETIIRRRTMNEFLRRCAAFTPPRDTIPNDDLAHLPAPTRERLA